MAKQTNLHNDEAVQPWNKEIEDQFLFNLVQQIHKEAAAYAHTVLGRGCSLTSRRAKSVIGDYITGVNCLLLKLPGLDLYQIESLNRLELLSPKDK